MSEWIGVDLDGTLAHYDKWRGADHIGEAIEPMVARVKRWLAEGRDVRIFTARISTRDPLELQIVKDTIDFWCKFHLGRALPVTNVKDFGMSELWDDRAVGVEANTGRMLCASRRGLDEMITP